MEHKTFAAEIKSVDEDRGEIEAYVAAFNNIDHQGDKILPGAFAKTLLKRKSFPMLWQHDTNQPVGKWTPVGEDENGLLMKGKFAMKTQGGREAFELAKEQIVTQCSIGYMPTDTDFESIEGKSVRLLKEIDLYEASLVTFPANEQAIVVGVKADFTDEERRRMADEGVALPDGSFPIRNRDDLHNAIQAIGRAKDPDAARRHIIKRARALGAEDMLPDDWKSNAADLDYALDVIGEWFAKYHGDVETKAGARNSAADQSRIQLVHDMAQAMHDHATALGAECDLDGDGDVESMSAGMDVSHRYLPMSGKQAAEMVARIVAERIYSR